MASIVHSAMPPRCDTGLPALDVADAERLLDAHAPDLSADLRSRFLKEASGNPLALVELPRGERVADARDTPWLPADGAPGARLLKSFVRTSEYDPNSCCSWRRKTTRHRSTKFCMPAKRCWASVVGVDALTPAIAAKLIEIDGTEVRFRHPLVRSAMHQAADLATRQRIHAALAATIQGQLDRQLWHRAVGDHRI